MATFKKNERVFIPAEAREGVIEDVIPKAEGLWAEQFYSVQLDDYPLGPVTLQENALQDIKYAPDWDVSDYPPEGIEPVTVVDESTTLSWEEAGEEPEVS